MQPEDRRTLSSFGYVFGLLFLLVGTLRLHLLLEKLDIVDFSRILILIEITTFL